ncbi:MAG: hypothetical protein GXP62_15080, partial [Oligoflexia bacterium]|nr:hypothetical protein [Oligoflexia bacterium]
TSTERDQDEVFTWSYLVDDGGSDSGSVDTGADTSGGLDAGSSLIDAAPRGGCGCGSAGGSGLTLCLLGLAAVVRRRSAGRAEGAAWIKAHQTGPS